MLLQALGRIFRARSALLQQINAAAALADSSRIRLELGTGTYARAPRIVAYRGDPDYTVRVGRYTSIAEDVSFFIGGGHHVEWITTFPFRAVYDLPGKFEDGHPQSRGPITVGSDVWVGRGATILSGVSIGDGAVIGALALVTKDVPPYTIVTGVPATVMRSRFPAAVVEQLLQLRWWDWPEEEILSVVDVLCSDDVGSLLRYGRNRTHHLRENTFKPSWRPPEA